MKIVPLTALEIAATGFSHKITVKLADMTAAGATTSTTIGLLTLYAGQFVDKAGYARRTDFTGTGLTNMTLSVGDNGTTNTWFSTADVNQTGAVLYGVSNTAQQYTTTSTVQAILTATGANLSALTAGELDIYLRVVDYTATGM